MSIDINLNVNVYVGADKTLTDALVYAGGWAANLYKVMHPHATKPPISKEDVQALKENSEYPRKSKQEQAEKSPVAASDSVPTEGASVPAKSGEKAPETAKPPEKEKPVENPDAKVAGDALVELRKAVNTFVMSDTTGTNRQKLRSWLDEHGFPKVPDVTNAKAPELLAFFQKEGAPNA